MPYEQYKVQDMVTQVRHMVRMLEKMDGLTPMYQLTLVTQIRIEISHDCEDNDESEDIYQSLNELL